MATQRTQPRHRTDARARDEAREARQQAEEDQLDGLGVNPNDPSGGGGAGSTDPEMDYSPDAAGPDLTNSGSDNPHDLVDEKGPGSLGANSPYEGNTDLPGDPMGAGLDDLGRGAPDVGPAGLPEGGSGFPDPLAGSAGPGEKTLEGSNAAGGLPDWMGSVGTMGKGDGGRQDQADSARDALKFVEGGGAGSGSGGASNAAHLEQVKKDVVDAQLIGPNNPLKPMTEDQANNLAAVVEMAKAETPAGETATINTGRGQLVKVKGEGKPEGDSAGQPAEPDVDPETEAAWRDYGEEKSNYMQIKFDSIENDDITRDPLGTELGGTTPAYDGTDYGPDGEPKFGSGGGAEISPKDNIDYGPDYTGDASSDGPDTDDVGQGPLGPDSGWAGNDDGDGGSPDDGLPDLVPVSPPDDEVDVGTDSVEPPSDSIGPPTDMDQPAVEPPMGDSWSSGEEPGGSDGYSGYSNYESDADPTMESVPADDSAVADFDAG